MEGDDAEAIQPEDRGAGHGLPQTRRGRCTHRQQAGAAGGGRRRGRAGKKDEVVEAEFEEVDEKKK